jgi:NADH-quinone oxidoreductase subunit N
LLPEIALSLIGIAIMLAAPLVSAERQSRLGYVALGGFLLAMLLISREVGGPVFAGMIIRDGFARFSKLLFLVAGGGVLLCSIPYLERARILRGEFFSLLLFATVGMCLMTNSADLIMTFLGLEVLSISTYVLAGFKHRDARSNESALKYFLLGSLSTAFLLYGMAFLYGSTGSTRFAAMGAVISSGTAEPTSLLFGLGLIIVGFGFKAALAPFHVWTPDVYEGAPIPVTAHLAVASKAAAFLTFVRVLQQALPGVGPSWHTVLWASAFVTMLLGNLAALVQSNIKRMLAYSSIAHAGYLLVGVVSDSSSGVEGVLFYLVAYALMTLGAFAVIQVIAREEEQKVNLEDFAGVGRRHPFPAFCLSVFLLSLAGIPATAGFIAKFLVFTAAMERELYVLVVAGLLASAAGLYYYLHIIVLMYMREPQSEDAPAILPAPVLVVIAIMLTGTLYLGIFPGRLLSFAREAAGF